MHRPDQTTARHRAHASLSRTVPALAALVLTLAGCASKTDRDAQGDDVVGDPQVISGLQDEGSISFVDHVYSSSTIQAQVLAQVFQQAGADAKVQTIGDIATAYPAVSKDESMFDPEIWRFLAKPQYQQYVEEDKTVEAFDGSRLTATEGWYVPTYVIEGDADRGIEPTCPGLPDWRALNDCADVFATAKTGDKGQYMSGAKEWGDYYGDPQRIANLDLDYELVFAGSEAALNAEWKRAYEKGDPFLGLMWLPTYTGLKYDLTRVEFPPYTPECWSTTFACNWEDILIDQIASVDFKEAHPTAMQVLEKYDLSDDDILAIMTLVEDEGLEPADAVTTWMEENPDTWQAWLS